MEFTANTASLEQLFNELDVNQRLTPMLKLRGAVAYRAAKLAGMVMAKRAKVLRDAEGVLFPDAMNSALTDIDMFNREQAALTDIDMFNEEQAALSTEEFDAWALEKMGLETIDMLEQLRTMVCYANKLNFDMLDMIDPAGTKRMEPGFKQQGVYHDDRSQRESWLRTIELHKADRDTLDCETYAEYVAKMEGTGAFTLNEAEWTQLMTEENLFDEYAEVFADCILLFGDEEAEFTDLPERTQISLIEGLRSKLDDIASKLVKFARYMRVPAAQKVAEASKVKGLVLGWDKLLCEMLELPRFRPFAGFMYSYTPGMREVRPESVKTRRIIQKVAPVGRVDDVTAQRLNGVAEEDIERDAASVDDALRVASY